MAYVIKAVAYAREWIPCDFAGQYLEWYDPTLPANKVMAGFTPDLVKAKKFDSPAAAMEEWNRVREVDPVRPDGKPNKPLTAITISIESEESQK